MANQLGSLTVAPREYDRHRRHEHRQHHAKQAKAFLAEMVTQFEANTSGLTVTEAQVIAKLLTNSAARIKAAAQVAHGWATLA